MSNVHQKRRLGYYQIIFAALTIVIFSASGSLALTISAVGSDGGAITEFYYTVQKDLTYDIIPNVQTGDTLSTGFHISHNPVTKTGDQDTLGDISSLSADVRYYVSILPKGGYTSGGAMVAVGQGQVTVVCNPLPIPTAQISIFVFEDNQPLNNAYDLPVETGLAGFKVLLEDPGGRYGAAGGQMMMDAFGNMIGTTYERDPTDGSIMLDVDGNPIVAQMGQMFVVTDPNGHAFIRNLAPGKYGVRVIPPPGSTWRQTSTIEGTVVIDAWVKANEPPYFLEWGPAGPHVFVGFIQPFKNLDALNGEATVTGQVVSVHSSRPPALGFFPGKSRSNAWVGLNLNGGNGKAIWAQPADPETGEFSIPNVPIGIHQLVVWDEYLDLVIGFYGLTVTAGQTAIDLGPVTSFEWFAKLNNVVFYDANENGFRDPGERGIPEQNVNIRWRDGTIYQAMPTDVLGESPFEEIFPFFHWLVAEVDYARFKPTGATIVVDDGGPINPADRWSYDGLLNPRPEGNGQPYRLEVGNTLTQAFQVFLGQTNAIEWGKKEWGPGENGGISGMVVYAHTRAEDDPRFAGAEPWEPGIPRVQVALYADGDVDVLPYGDFPEAGDIDWDADGVFDAPDTVIDDVNGDAAVTLADVDNYPLGWSEGGLKGPEDVDHNIDGIFDAGDAIQITYTDSWDDSWPTGCPETYSLHGVPADCFDGMRNFNQVRPGVFDGGYAFDAHFPGGIESGSAEVGGLPAGIYIVQAAVPHGYTLLKEEDKNVDFGENYVGQDTLYNTPICVGADHLVPLHLALFPGDMIEAPYGGEYRPLCDLKQVRLTNGQNPPADFFLFTQAPLAANVVGIINDDLDNEFDPFSPVFGEKYAPPWLPVSFNDFTGREIARVYSDEFGAYNAMLPPSYTNNLGMPSGVSPGMYEVCINTPYMPDPINPGNLIEDPFFNPQYGNTCRIFQFMPGVTTYLDTPIVPKAAHTGRSQYPLDCEFPEGTPMIARVDSADGGPFVVAPAQNKEIMIYSRGQVEVPNPEYEGPGGTNSKTIFRDYGFGTVEGEVTLNGDKLNIQEWTPGLIRAKLQSKDSTGQLVVERGDNGQKTLVGVTVHIGPAGAVTHVAAGQSIQAAIDAASAGDLILVGPGEYRELLIFYKDVILQGYGSGDVVINAVKWPKEILGEWRTKIKDLYDAEVFDLLPGQDAELDELGTNIFFAGQEGPGILVVNKAGGFNVAMIDGLTIAGAQSGGGVLVNGYGANLTFSNNRLINNQGSYGGGIRLGQPLLVVVDQLLGREVYVDAENDNIKILHNQIIENGGLSESGGGVSICTGADDYEVANNYICGNLTIGYGGGIGHQGRSDSGLILDNTILFNKSFSQAGKVGGGGVSILGGAPVGLETLSPGSGSVTLNRNLIQANLAGAGDGGGVSLEQVNGQELLSKAKFKIQLFNNIIVNNIAGNAGGGVAAYNAVDVDIIHNTISNNDSTATATATVEGGPALTVPTVAGLAYRMHSAALYAAMGETPPAGAVVLDQYPLLVNNIITGNRSFHWDSAIGLWGGLAPDIDGGDAPVYNDLAPVGYPAGSRLDPRNSVLTDTVGYHGSNISVDPGFVTPYENGSPGGIKFGGNIIVQAAFDEGGNFIDLRFGPLTPSGDYHLIAKSDARGEADPSYIPKYSDLEWDIDIQPRPFAGKPDIGADEFSNRPSGGAPSTPTTPSLGGGGGGGGGGCFIGSLLSK